MHLLVRAAALQAGAVAIGARAIDAPTLSDQATAQLGILLFDCGEVTVGTVDKTTERLDSICNRLAAIRALE